ncbi:MAG: BMP family ABC transporter substrate-binding protein, partial [Candidatus Kariarchaeaceae archaeon]
VHSIVFREEQGAFLAGALAALTSKTGKLGFLGGEKIPLIDAFYSGFAQGAKYVDPTIDVADPTYGDPANPWNDVIGGKAIGETLYGTGIDIVFAAAGGTGIGVMQAAQEKNDLGGEVWVVGVDSDQDFLFPGTILASVLKRVDVAIKTTIDSVVDQTWVGGGNITVGIPEGMMGISEMKHDEQASVRDAVCGTMTRLEYVNSLGPSVTHDPLATGTFVNRSIVDPAAYNTVPHPCGTAPPPPANTTITETTVSVATSVATSVETSVSVSVSTDEGGLPVSILPVFAAVFTTIFFIRKKK